MISMVACAEETASMAAPLSRLPATDTGEVRLSLGQTVYVPIYSQIYHGDLPSEFLLTGVLSIRNTDSRHAIQILSATYYDSAGRVVREYLPRPIRLAPLSATQCLVPESDSAGGVGAAFLVRWKSQVAVNQPIMESVMISTRSQQGLSFISRGQVIAERLPT